MGAFQMGATFQIDDTEILHQMEKIKYNQRKFSKCADNLVLVDGPVVIDWGAFSRLVVIDSHQVPRAAEVWPDELKIYNFSLLLFRLNYSLKMLVTMWRKYGENNQNFYV